MSGRSGSWLAAWAFGCAAMLSASGAHAAASGPLVPQISRCIPIADADPTTGVGGLTPALRRIQLQFGYAVRAAADNTQKADALTQTRRVELCTVRAVAMGMYTSRCPASEAMPDNRWLVFDDVTKPIPDPADPGCSGGKPADATFVKLFGDPGARECYRVPFDYEDATQFGTLIVVRVNSENIDTEIVRRAGGPLAGWCPAVQPVVNGTQFRALGAPNTIGDPFGLAAGGVCSLGNKSGANSTNACVDAIGPQFIVDRMPAIQLWQDTRAFGPLGSPPNEPSPPTWANGNTQQCSGAYCPTLVWMYADDGAAHGGLGQFTMVPALAVSGAAVPRDLSPGAGADLRLMGHEFWHNLEGSWARARGTGHQFASSWFEETPVAIEVNFCLLNYPGLGAAQCASPRKLGFDWFAGVLVFNSSLDKPASDVFNWTYVGGSFWRYAAEQYAIAVNPNTPAHPSGTDSFIQANLSAALGTRPSDEGLDLLGRMYEEFATASTARPSDPTQKVMDDALRTHLGRGLDAMFQDLHTAGILKDYSSADPRWGLQWLGDFNAGNAMALVPGAPTPAAPLVMIKTSNGGKLTIKPDLVSAAEDGIIRARRILDSYEPCTPAAPATTCTPPRKTLAPGGFFASSQAQPLQPHGAAYFGVHPDPMLSMVRVRLTPQRGTQPRFRIFTVNAAGVPTLLSGCDVDPDGAAPDRGPECPLNESGVVDLMVGTTNVDEILTIVSAGPNPVLFDWSFGQVQPRLDIIDPTASHVARIGHPSSATRPFLVQFRVRDENNVGLDVSTANVHIFMTGCAGTRAPTCELTNGTDFQVNRMAPGLYWASGSIADATFYPASGTLLDLQVRADIPSGAQVSGSQARAIDTSAATKIITQFVLDKSGSMGDFSKLEGMQKAVGLLVNGMRDDDQVGIVTFHNDAQTVLIDGNQFTLTTAAGKDKIKTAVNALTAGGFTGIGDGLLEGQSNLANAFGDVALMDTVEHMIVLSDGLNNCGWEPRRYYESGPDQPIDGTAMPDGATDPDPADNQPWRATSPLGIQGRKNAGNWTPTVSAIAVGQDADLSELTNVALAGDGLFTYIDSPDTTSLNFLAAFDEENIRNRAITRFADAFRQSMNRATGHARVISRKMTQVNLDRLPDIRVESNVRELLVSLISASTADDLATLRLIAPDGTRHSPTISTPGEVFRVPNPAPGLWSWDRVITDPGVVSFEPGLLESEAPEPRAFVEAATLGGVDLVTRTDVTDRIAPQPAGLRVENGSWVGKDVLLRAIPIERLAIRAAVASAEITAPDQSTVTVSLLDNGVSNDGRFNDGVYGARYAGANTPGAYEVRYVVQGTDSAGRSFRKEKLEAFEVHDATDTDGDGIPDWTETKTGTDATRDDCNEDPDQDGLTNCQEFIHHTNPRQPDTDNGGEGDGSEVSSGKNPLNPADDTYLFVDPIVSACSGKVQLSFDFPSGASYSLEIQRAPNSQGPFLTVKNQLAPAPATHQVTAPNGQLSCYRARISNGIQVGPWSAVRCVTPAVDPFPPSLRLDPASMKGYSSDFCGDITVTVSDSPTLEAGHHSTCQDVSVSAIREMMVSSRADFQGAVWEPFITRFKFPLDASKNGNVWVKVRDTAGNESVPQSIALRNVGTGAPKEPRALACCDKLRDCRGAHDFVLFAQGALTINDRGRVLSSSGGSGPVVNEGTGVTNLGVDSNTGNVWSVGNVFARERARVEGILTTSGTLTRQNGVVITGGFREHIPLTLPSLAAFAITFPATNLGSRGVEPDQTLVLDPGSYNAISVKSRAKLLLRSGTYYMNSFNLEPQGEVRFDTSKGPVFLYVKTSFTHKGVFNDTSGRQDQVFVGFFGTSDAFVESAFAGTIVAPKAKIWLKTTATPHRGSFFAKNIDLSADARVEHRPFLYQWTFGVGFVAGTAWHSESETVQTGGGGCGCNVADRHSFAPWLVLAFGLAGWIWRRRSRGQRARARDIAS